MKRKIIKAKRFMGMFVVLLIGLISLQGCATAPQQPDFMDQETKLIPDPEDASLLWWEKPGFNWHHYSKLMFDPVSIKIDAKMEEKKLNYEELAEFSRDITEAVIEKLKPEYSVVNTPGTDVLRIRVAIIDIDTSNPVINLATTLAVFVPLDMGGAAIAVEFLDSLTGERLAAMVDRKTGTPLQLFGGFSRFGHARAAFDQWAEALKLALMKNP